MRNKYKKKLNKLGRWLRAVIRFLFEWDKCHYCKNYTVFPQSHVRNVCDSCHKEATSKEGLDHMYVKYGRINKHDNIYNIEKQFYKMRKLEEEMGGLNRLESLCLHDLSMKMGHINPEVFST